MVCSARSQPVGGAGVVDEDRKACRERGGADLLMEAAPIGQAVGPRSSCQPASQRESTPSMAAICSVRVSVGLTRLDS